MKDEESMRSMNHRKNLIMRWYNQMVRSPQKIFKDGDESCKTRLRINLNKPKSRRLTKCLTVIPAS